MYDNPLWSRSEVLIRLLITALSSPPHNPNHLVIRFVDTYFSTFPGYYDTMDAGVKDEHGYIKVRVVHAVGNTNKRFFLAISR